MTRLRLIVLLNVLYCLDQWPRRFLRTLEMTYLKQKLMRYIDWQDRHNRAIMSRIFQKHGWIDRNRYGERAATAAFLIVQHSPHAFMKQHVEWVRDAVCRGEAEAKHLALMIDRLLMYRGKKQIYGTQRMSDLPEGPFQTWPIVKPAAVSIRRMKMGLTLLSQADIDNVLDAKLGESHDRIEDW